MKIKQIFIALISVFFMVCIAVIFLATKLNNQNNAACQRMTNLAMNSEKVAHILEWSSKNLNDLDFAKRVGESTRIDYFSDKDLIDSINLDWTALGLDKKSVYLSFNRKLKDRKEPKNFVNTKSIGIGEGRYGLIIKLTDEEDFGFNWSKKMINRLIKINSRVYVECNN